MAAYGSGRSIPLGWQYDAVLDVYMGPNHEHVTRQEIAAHGSIEDVLKHRRQTMVTTGIPIQNQVTAGPPWTLSNFDNLKPASNLTITGKLGKITINLDTGELTIPPGVGRDAAIRDFWLAFQEHFQPTNKAHYEKEIASLKKEIEDTKYKAEEYRKYVGKEGMKVISEKIQSKYGNEKFIMIKPADLIKFIEEA